MNFNLVSPKGKGSTFTTRFQEEIEIPADAKVALNFAKLTKDSRILLNEENTVDLEFIEPIPFRDTAGAEAYPQAITTDRRITIPKGVYSSDDLQQRITDGIQRTLNIGDADVGTLTHNLNGMYNANVLSNSRVLRNKQTNKGQQELGITFQKNKFIDETVITSINNLQTNRLTVRDWEHGANAHQNDRIGGKTGTYRKSSAGWGNLDYDNYGLDDLKLYHYGLNMKAWDNYRQGLETGVANTRNTIENISTGDIDNQSNNYPFVSFKTDKTLAEIRQDNTANDRGGNFVGLLSKNYMVGTPIAPNINTTGYVASAGRFSGNNPPQTDDAGQAGGNKVPICYLGVEVGQHLDAPDNDAYINIFIGKNGNGTLENPTAFPHNGAPITSMENIGSWRIDDDELDPTEQVHILIFPYFKADPRKARTSQQTDTTGGFINRKQLHYQIILRSEAKDTIIHDTLADTIIGSIGGLIMDGFETEFARADPPVVLTENQIDAQIPFNVIVASKDNPAEISAGLVDIRFTALPEKTANQNLFPTIIDGVRFKFSPELGGIVSNTANNLNSLPITTNYIYPSLASEAQGFFQLQAIPSMIASAIGSLYASLLKYGEIYSSGKTKSYSVYIENLPLRNYKNRITEVEGGQKGGIKKNILKTIPLPFSQNTVSYGLDRIAYYEPNNKEVSMLKNQEFKTNSFDIEIRDMETDKIATDIKSAVFNFTITP